ncbi:MAG: peptide-methionine (S)-S-oxide reductase MsrA [Candidatus Eremiobacteraeota bacterium]|nr:peptide-methionine (S)-S-oxide reductase MsrA [Candidatus Eremiobacteraeota bacterium]
MKPSLALLGALALALGLPAASHAAGNSPTLAPLERASDWINGTARPASLAGKVVVVDVFTFGCINCKNVTPNLRTLHRRVSPSDLAIVGVHTPETPYETDRANVVRALKEQNITWPVAIDNAHHLWDAFGVDAWPTQLVYDRSGKLRDVVVGDSQDGRLDAIVRKLISERQPARRVKMREVAASHSERIVLAGGCFWGVEAVFDRVKGVSHVVSGYAGGKAATAHYEIVSTGMTGHAESVEVTYDPSKVSVEQLLRVYFMVAHDPTELNRQGPDEGSQYRSEIYYTTPEQKKAAEAMIASFEKRHAFDKPIVTKVEALPAFYPAEAYHQHFLDRNPTYPYIVYNDLPKLEKLKKTFPDLTVAALK